MLIYIVVALTMLSPLGLVSDLISSTLSLWKLSLF